MPSPFTVEEEARIREIALEDVGVARTVASAFTKLVDVQQAAIDRLLAENSRQESKLRLAAPPAPAEPAPAAVA